MSRRLHSLEIILWVKQIAQLCRTRHNQHCESRCQPKYSFRHCAGIVLTIFTTYHLRKDFSRHPHQEMQNSMPCQHQSSTSSCPPKQPLRPHPASTSCKPHSPTLSSRAAPFPFLQDRRPNPQATQPSTASASPHCLLRQARFPRNLPRTPQAALGLPGPNLYW